MTPQHTAHQQIQPSLKTFLAYILIFFGLWFILTGAFKLLGGSTSSGWTTFFFLISKSALFIILPYVYIRFVRRTNFAEFVGLGGQRSTIIYRYLLPTFVLVGASVILVWSGVLGINQMVYPLPILWVAGLIVAPITEEIAFRGMIFGEGKYHLRPQFNWLLNAILFVLIHSSAWLYYPDKDHQILLFSVTTFFFNYILVWSYTQSKSIYPPILVHFLNNYLSVLMIVS